MAICAISYAYSMKVRFAVESDWPMLVEFYLRVYRPHHPLHSKEFWMWRFGDPGHGSAVIAESNGSVVGHVGINRSSGVAWIINLYLDVDQRGQGLLTKLFALAGTRGLLASANINGPGIGMFKKMEWIEHPKLIRYVLADVNLSATELLAPSVHSYDAKEPTGNYYWKQPGIKGILMEDGSTCIDFMHFGGIRLVEIGDTNLVAGMMKSLNARWADYVTSPNDPLCDELVKLGWKLDYEALVPWLFDPIDLVSRMDVNVFAKLPLPESLIIRRWDSDHGRIGSI